MDDDTKPSLGRRQAVAALLALGSMAGPTGAAAGGHGGAGRTGLRQDPSGAAAGLYAEIDAVLKQTEAIWNMNKFYESLTGAMSGLTKVGENTTRFTSELGKLADNLTSLNNVYGSMLTAMRGGGPKQ